jgi:hypothetical protein
MLAQASLVYILHLDSTEVESATTQDAELYPLFDCAVKYWDSHAQEAGASKTEGLSALIQDVLSTRWEIYRLVTYPNTSTIYNPWPASLASTKDYPEFPAPSEDLCETCQQIRFRRS